VPLTTSQTVLWTKLRCIGANRIFSPGVGFPQEAVYEPFVRNRNRWRTLACALARPAACSRHRATVGGLCLCGQGAFGGAAVFC
jgi:hypothetical protein